MRQAGIGRRLVMGAVIAGLAAVPVGCGGAPGAGASGGEVAEFLVAGETVRCTGEGEQDCLQIDRGEGRGWELFYDDIAGFSHEPGTEHRLRVRVTPVADPPADGSSLADELVEVLDERPSD